jgi:hypothetical protein
MTAGNSPAALLGSAVLAAAVVSSACDGRGAEVPETIETTLPVVAAIVDSATVANLTFMSQFTETGFVTLVDGAFIDEEQQIHVALDPHVAFGNLDEDEAEEAVAILGTNTGGSGGFLDLAVIEDREGTAANSAMLYLGDRLRIHSLAIVDGEIVLDVTMHAPDDPMCCPSRRKTRRFQVERGALVEVGGE